MILPAFSKGKDMNYKYITIICQVTLKHSTIITHDKNIHDITSIVKVKIWITNLNMPSQIETIALGYSNITHDKT